MYQVIEELYNIIKKQNDRITKLEQEISELKKHVINDEPNTSEGDVLISSIVSSVPEDNPFKDILSEALKLTEEEYKKK